MAVPSFTTAIEDHFDTVLHGIYPTQELPKFSGASSDALRPRPRGGGCRCSSAYGRPCLETLDKVEMLGALAA